MTTITAYKATDGKLYETMTECVLHEQGSPISGGSAMTTREAFECLDSLISDFGGEHDRSAFNIIQNRMMDLGLVIKNQDKTLKEVQNKPENAK